MFRVVTPSNAFYVTPEQLPRFLANLSETRYINTDNGEFLQTTSQHELVKDSTTVTLLVKQPLKATMNERDQYQDMWRNEKAVREDMESQVESLRVMLSKVAKKVAKKKRILHNKRK
jgi:hypothetical protein